MKKFIIPLAAVIAASAAAISLIIVNSNKTAVADKPAPPAEIPSGNYYVSGDLANDDLYLVVDGKTIHFESSTDLREAFRERALLDDPHYLDDKDALERQTDQDMADWGGESYTYTVKNQLGDSKDLYVCFRITEDENGISWTGQALPYYVDTKTIHSWAGDFVLAKTKLINNISRGKSAGDILY